MESLRCAWRRWLAAVLAIVSLGALWRRANVEGDTEVLVREAAGIVRCLHEQRSHGCPEAGKFALLQHLIAVPLRAAGVSAGDVELTLARLSIPAFLGILLLCWKVLKRRSPALGRFAALLLITGLPIHYSNRSFGEMAAAFVVCAYAAAWLEGRTAAVGVAAFVAALGKETAFPLLALLGVACAQARHPEISLAALFRSREEARRFGWASLGLAAAIAACAMFNLFRFGVIYNLSYFRETTWAPGLSIQAVNALALWVAPNAGLLFFWPSFVAVLGTVPLAARRASLRPFWAVMFVLAALTALCAGWWAPFGWAAWGQRLTIPWLPALLLVLGYAYAAPLEKVVRWLFGAPARATATTAALIFLALPHVSSLFRYGELVTYLDVEPPCGLPDIPATHASYYRCLLFQAWEHRPSLFHAYGLVIVDPTVRPRAAVYAVLLAVVGGAFYRSCRAASETKEARWQAR